MSRTVDAIEHADFPWGAVSVLVVLAVLFGGLARLGGQPLQLEVYGNVRYADMDQMTETMHPLLQQGFFGLRKQQLNEALRQIPWIRESEAELLWPNRLALRLVEHQVVARMESGGVLVDGGDVIDQEVEGHWPVVQSTVNRRADVVDVLTLVATACPQCTLSRLELRPGDQLRLSLLWQQNPIEVELGRPSWEPALNRLTNHALPELGDRLAEVALIDLRHRHAYAVRWRELNEKERHS